MSTQRAHEIWEAFCGELIDNGVKDGDDVRQGLSTAIRIVADRLCTDVGELHDHIDIIREIADELDEMK